MWLPHLAKSLGLKPQTLRSRINMAGHAAPFDEEITLKIVEGLGLPLDKYYAWRARSSDYKRWKAKHPDAAAKEVKSEPQMPLLPAPPPVAPSQEVVVARLPAAHGGKRTVTPEGIKKMKEAWERKLIPRLARLLREGSSVEGKKIVRKILKDGGYGGPRWDDEVLAIKIFREAGIDTRKFEWAKPENRTAIRANGAVVIEGASIEEHPDFWLIAAAKEARLYLEQFEEGLFQARLDGRILKEISPLPLGRLALNCLRTPPRKRRPE